MQRCAIVIHSVNGNVYIIANHMKEVLVELGVDARLYRVADEDLHIWANKSDAANDFYEDISSLPIIHDSSLEKSMMVIFGSPTMFSNVSAEMKTFMDSTSELCRQQGLSGKFFGCFTSSSGNLYQGACCIDTMVRFSQAHGMIHVPAGIDDAISASVQVESGIVHLAGEESEVRPSAQFGDRIRRYCETVAEILNDE